MVCSMCFKTMENLLLLGSDVLQNECILATNQSCNMELDQLIISSRLFSQKLTVSHPAKKSSAFSAKKKKSPRLCSWQLNSEFYPD
jgi:hypothetical protein